MAPKDKDHKCQKSRVIYWFKCPHSNFQEEYIGKSWRSFEDRLKEYFGAPSPIHNHFHTTGYPANKECFTIVVRESWGLLGPLRKLCTFGLMTHPLTGIWGNISCTTYGTRYFKTPHHYGSSNSTPQPSSLCHPPHIVQYAGAYTILIW